MASASRIIAPVRGSLAAREAIWFYILIAPWIAGFLLFTAGPILASIYLSFTEADPANFPPTWIGLGEAQVDRGEDRPSGEEDEPGDPGSDQDVEPDRLPRRQAALRGRGSTRRSCHFPKPLKLSSGVLLTRGRAARILAIAESVAGEGCAR